MKIKEVLNRPIPEKLWHYTSIQGFQGIVTSKRIFATDTRFLNDSEEIIHTKIIASQVISESPEIGAYFFNIREYLKKAVDYAFDSGSLNPSRTQIYVASFSEVADQLSQWRGYAHGSSGVSLGLDLRSLRPPAGIDTLVTFAPCVYEDADKKLLIREALDHFVQESQDLWTEIVKKIFGFADLDDKKKVQENIAKVQDDIDFTKRLTSAMVRTQAALLQIAAIIKNKAFYEEQEWRLVLPVNKDKLSNPRRFRPSNTTLIPYIAHPLPKNTDDSLTLVDLVLGPGSHMYATQAALSFLKTESLSIVPRESKVPYRPW